MMKRARRLFVPYFTMALVVLLLAPAGTAWMQDSAPEIRLPLFLGTTTAENVQLALDSPRVLEYAQRENLAPQAAAIRMAYGLEFDELFMRIAQNEPDFVGMWYVDEPPYGLRVGFAGTAGEAILAKYLDGEEWAPLVTAQPMQYTARELYRAQLAVYDFLQTTGLVFDLNWTRQYEQVMVLAHDPDAVWQRLQSAEAMQPYLDMVRVMEDDTLPLPPVAEVGDPAYPAPEPPPSVHPGITDYAKMVGTTYAVAEKRLTYQQVMRAWSEQVRAHEPDFVIAWPVHVPDYGYGVGFTVPNGDEILQKYLEGIEWSHLVSAKQLKYTLDELSALQSTVYGLLQGKLTTPLHATGANIQESKVNLYTPDPDALAAELATMDAIQPYLEDIEIVLQEHPAAPAVPAADTAEDVVDDALGMAAPTTLPDTGGGGMAAMALLGAALLGSVVWVRRARM